MSDRLWLDLDNESYEVEHPVDGKPTMVVDMDDIKAIVKKHDYLKLGDALKSVAPYQPVVIKAATTINEYDFLGTAQNAIDGALYESLKNVTNDPFEMNVAKMEARTGYFLFEEKELDKPVIYIIVN